MVSVSSLVVAQFLADRSLEARVRPDTVLEGQAALAPGRRGHVSFASRRTPETAQQLATTRSSLLLVLPEYFETVPVAADVIAVEQPRREFARVVTEFFVSRVVTGIHPRAVIDPGSTIGQDPSIGPGAVVSANVSIGTRVSIGANAVILPGTTIGDDVQIGPGTVIGHNGFGYAREDDGTPILIPHTGGVRIGDRVEIGANTTIDRGTLADTVIQEDAKIDNLVHIAHNCTIGDGAFVIATAILCGGVTVGDGAWVAPNAAVREQVSIGAGAVVGLSATVTRPVPDGVTVIGSPARELDR